MSNLYAFQGMEKDDEIKGEGSSYTTEFRQLDTRLGRWLSLDPLMAKYPNQSPYEAFNNNPLFFMDPTGLEGEPKQGDIKTENDIEQVYTGGGEGEGWKNTTEVLNFQASGGNGVFVRGGDQGCYTYQKIESVVISIGMSNEYNSTSSTYSGQLDNSNSWLIRAEDIEDAYTLFKEKFGAGNTLGTLVIDTHGGIGKDRNDISTLAYLNTTSSAPAKERLERYAISDADFGKKSTGVSQLEYDDAIAFNSFVSSISNGGILILTGCKIGADRNLFQAIDWTTDKNIIIYANKDFTKVDVYTNTVKISTELIKFVHGWVKYDSCAPKNKLTSVGNVEFNF